MKNIISILISLSILGCKQNIQPRSNFLELNDPLPESALSLNEMMPTQYGDSLALFDYEFKGSHFSVGSDSHGKVKYIMVKDSAFTTPEGIRLGDPGSKLDKVGKPIGSWDRGYCTVRLNSGWIVLVEGGGSYNVSGLIQYKHPIDTIITCIFKHSDI